MRVSSIPTVAPVRVAYYSQGATFFEWDGRHLSTAITNLRTGHVFYSRTHDFSSVAVASDDISWTRFDVPAAQETGLSKLEVAASGIASDPVTVLVTGRSHH